MTRRPSGDEIPDSSWAGLSAADGDAIDLLPTEASATEIAKRLGLEPHREGGFFRETYRSPLRVRTGSGMRPLATAILYLLTRADPSRFHRLRFDEMWFFHAGCRAELVLLKPGAPSAASRPRPPGPYREGHGPDVRLLGPDRPQALVPAGRWMGARVSPGEAAGRVRAWTLVGCVVTPGFEYEDFEPADREVLLREFPEDAKIIYELT